jgi:protein-S-isoprenylcysteine O-methyltransferase Ste14
MLCALVVALSAVWLFRRFRTTVHPEKPENTTALVMTGIYRLTRNPMYVGVTLALLGWAVWLRVPVALLGPVAFVLYVNRFQIVPEERVLASKFGEAYAAYCRRVRRWV